MYMLVSIASALVSVYACMLGCMYVCELGGSFAGGCPSLAIIYIYITAAIGKTIMAEIPDRSAAEKTKM